jgi:hypothetical protein
MKDCAGDESFWGGEATEDASVSPANGLGLSNDLADIALNCLSVGKVGLSSVSMGTEYGMWVSNFAVLERTSGVMVASFPSADNFVARFSVCR